MTNGSSSRNCITEKEDTDIGRGVKYCILFIFMVLIVFVLYTWFPNDILEQLFTTGTGVFVLILTGVLILGLSSFRWQSKVERVVCE